MINIDHYTLEELQDLRDRALKAYQSALASSEYIIEDRDIQVKHQNIEKIKDELDMWSEAVKNKQDNKSSKIKLQRGVPLG